MLAVGIINLVANLLFKANASWAIAPIVVFSLGWSAGLEVGRGEAPNPTTSISVESGEPGE